MKTLFLRLLAGDDKARAMAQAIDGVRDGAADGPAVHLADPESFHQVPTSPFAYWVSENVRRLFTELPPFGGEERTIKQGLGTLDDFRFVRAWWEVASSRILDGANGPAGDVIAFRHWCRGRTFQKSRWAPLAKGGEYSPYHADLYLVVNWERDGEEMKAWIPQVYGGGHWSRNIRNVDFYFRLGLTWPRRTDRLSFRPLPLGCVLGDKGPAVFDTQDDPESLCGQLPIVNSLPFYSLVRMLVARVDLAQGFEPGLVRLIPVPRPAAPDGAQLANLAHRCVDLKRDLDRANEISHVFHLPALLQVEGGTLAERLAAWHTRVAETERQLAVNQREIDEIASRLYGIEGEDRRAMEADLTSRPPSLRGKGETDAAMEEDAADEDDQEGGGEESEAEAGPPADARGLVAGLISYAVGCAFGRWDVRFATGQRTAPELPDPFAPLPVCSPGMLTGVDGLPLREPPAGYPLEIATDGILVDDPDHPDDIVRRVRAVLELIWCEREEAIEREACAILGVKELRDYLRNPRLFFEEHIKRHSKSRRKAPLYWLLQSGKRSYGLWLYYHRLDADLLYKALTNYVEPKIRLEEAARLTLRAQREAAGSGGAAVRQLERDLERQEALLSELHDFHDKLERVTELQLRPDLDDGVLLNIAPLRELAPWKAAKAAWDELQKGKYAWSSVGEQLRAKGAVR